MTDRVKLIIIILSILLFFSIFGRFLDFFITTMVLVAFMTLYIVFILLCNVLKKPTPIKNPNYNPFVSIVISCRNEEKVIEKTVENILNIDYENYELILIDDRSIDKTSEIMQKLSENNDKIKYLKRTKEDFPGKAAALNDSLKIAKGEAILVLDADAKIKPDFINKILVKLEPDNIAAVQAQKVIINREENILTRCQYNQYIFDCYIQSGRDAVGGAAELRGNGEIIKRKVLDEIGGWNNETITDDLDLSTKMHVNGWNIRFCNDTQVFEEGILDYIGLLKQGRRWVEGGGRRFLTYLHDFFFLRKMSLKIALDIICYITLFVSPLWLLIGSLLVLFNGNTTLQNYISAILILGVMAEILFGISLYYAMKRYGEFTSWHPLKEIIVTSIYVTVFWLPLTFVVILKIIFMPHTMTWGKTAHGITDQTEICD